MIAQWLGIYEIDGDTLRVCYRVHGKGEEARARVFDREVAKGGGILATFKKQPKHP